MMIVGLCLDGGRSLFSKFYKTRIMQFLGRISMSLYLVHEPIIYYINWVYFGSVKWLKDEDSPTNFAKPDYVKMPTQYVPVHICISLLAGIFLTLCIEEPARKFLTKKLRKAWIKKCIFCIVCNALHSMSIVIRNAIQTQCAISSFLRQHQNSSNQ